MFEIETLIKLIPGLPLASAMLTAVLGPRVLRSQSHIPTIVSILGSFVCSVMLLGAIRGEHTKLPETAVGFERVVNLWTWANISDAYQRPAAIAHEGGSGAPDAFDFRIEIALRADALTSMMLCMVTFIASLVAIFAAGYMHGDRGYWRFFSYVSLFVFSMTMLVSVSNFALLFVFWEAVGVCSYLLIGFWYQKPEAAAAGKKAFLVNRVGDFGFALALFLIWTTYGTLNFHDSPDSAAAVAVTQVDTLSTDTNVAFVSTVASTDSVAAATGTATPGVLGATRIKANDYRGGKIGLAICLLLMLGACGKSAQFPLHVWLPDAMEGPTPVSALIHAATMVTAGVYMVTRCTPLFMVSPDAQLVVACIGAFTALLAGFIALTQFDLKRVLAYSTVSQLGYMFLALGTGTLAGITGGMFHLFTHAFFKALLFLGAGSVMHAMGHIIDMRRFSGLRHVMPITHWTFFIGCLALAGVPPLAGFWSKDAVISSVHDKVHLLAHEIEHRDAHDAADATSKHGAADVAKSSESFQVALLGGGTSHETPMSSLTLEQLRRNKKIYSVLYYVAMLCAFMTAFYTFRAFFMTFYGEKKVPREAGKHAHESPPGMYWPLIVLAGCACVVGLLFDRTFWNAGHYFAQYLGHAPSLAGGFVAETLKLEKFHKDVAGISMVIASSGIGLALYLYLGDTREVAWLTKVAKLEELSKWLDVERVSRLKTFGPFAALHRGAASIGLGWLTSILGYLFLLVALLLSTPLMIGYYVSPYRLSFGKCFWDEIYDWTLVKPLRIAAWISYQVDRWLVDGVVNLVGRVPLIAGWLMRSLQMGLVPFYALAMALGAVILVAAKLLMAGG